MVDDPHRRSDDAGAAVHHPSDRAGVERGGRDRAGAAGRDRGHNERIAWGRTASDADEADVYVEQVNPANHDEVKWQGRWERLQVVSETINVRGEAHTRHAGSDIAARTNLLRGRGTPSRVRAENLDDGGRYRRVSRRAAARPGGERAGVPHRLAISARRRRPTWSAPTPTAISRSASAPPCRRVSGWNGRLPVPGDGQFRWGAVPRRSARRATTRSEAGSPRRTTTFSRPGSRRPSSIRASVNSAATSALPRCSARHPVHARRRVPDHRGHLQHRSGGTAAVVSRLDGSTPVLERARALVAAWDASMRKDSAAAAIYYELSRDARLPAARADDRSR